MEGSVLLAEHQLYTAQRAGRPTVDGAAWLPRDQAARWSEPESESFFQERQLQREGPSSCRRLHNGSRVSW